MKKKLVSILLIVVIVLNFILCNYLYASTEDVTKTSTRYGGDGVVDGNAAKGLVDSGKDSSGTTMSDKNFGVSLKGVVLQQIAAIIDAFPLAIQIVLTTITYNRITSSIESEAFAKKIAVKNNILGPNAYHYTIERTVFNEVALLNIDVFNQNKSYTIGSGEYKETIPQNSFNLQLKQSVTAWYYSIRLLAMMINLCILIYCGIRMAVSSIASEEAKYKKMIIWWAESMVMLFCLHYIMYAIIYLGNIILNIINILRIQTIENGNVVTFEDSVLNKVYLVLVNDSGAEFFLYSIFFWFLTFLQVKFFLLYMKRTFVVLFLILISPLITVTFPIDKFGNGKAEAYEMWLKEFVINVVIQPIHAIIYLVFIYTAGQIAETAPWVAMIFLLSIGRVENIIRNVFKITDSVDNVSMSKKQ